jgi:hypothetical protein
MAITCHFCRCQEAEPERDLIIPPQTVEEADLVFQIEDRLFNTEELLYLPLPRRASMAAPALASRSASASAK